MAEQYQKEHAAEIPNRVQVTDTLYADGEATVTYRFNWGITGDEVNGYDYYTRILQTRFPVGKTNIIAIRNGIREDYERFVAAWDAGQAERDQVAGWSDYVILE